MAADDWEGAAESIACADDWHWTAEQLKDRVLTFFGGDKPWSVVIPNERLIGVLKDRFEYAPLNDSKYGCAWFMGQIPLTNEPGDPLRDDIPLMGLAVSFFLREHEGGYAMVYEIFHL